MSIPNSRLDTMFTPARRTAIARAYVGSFCRSIARLALKRVRRERHLVSAEYDQGHWAKSLDRRGWVNASTLGDFLAGSSNVAILAKIDGRVVRTTTSAYYRFRTRALGEFLNRHLRPQDEVVELGCGTGMNLFALSLARQGAIHGFDISQNGVEAARATAKRFGLDGRMFFGRLDLIDGANPAFEAIRGRSVFTFFCLEQIPYSIEQVLRNILAQRPSRVVHVEPTVETLRLSDPMDLLNYLYVKSVDYQTRLFRTLQRLEEEGLVRILARERLPFAPTIQNDGFMISWEPRAVMGK